MLRSAKSWGRWVMGSDFSLFRLEDCLEAIIDYRGKTPRKTDCGIPLITAKIVKGGRISEATEFIAESDYDSWMRRGLPRVGDVVLTTEAPLGEVAQIHCLPVALAQRIVTLRGKSGVLENGYLLYALQTSTMQSRLVDRSSGTTVLGIKQSELRKVELEIPALENQRAVVEILKLLDDSIENLRQTNATLEAIAQALFKSWFVDFDPVRAKAEGREPEGMDAATAALFPSEFEESELGLIPKGWRVGTLGELCQNIRKQAKPESLDATTPYIGLEHMPRRSIALADAGTAGGLASGKFWYAKHDVLFGKLRPYFHKVGVASQIGVCSTDILVIRNNDPAWFGYTTMQLSSDAMIAHATLLSNGAKMPRSSWSDIASYSVVIPPRPISAAFDGLVRCVVARIHTSIDTMHSLSGIRDTLLPRLISGKLRLPDVEEAVNGTVQEANLAWA